MVQEQKVQKTFSLEHAIQCPREKVQKIVTCNTMYFFQEKKYKRPTCTIQWPREKVQKTYIYNGLTKDGHANDQENCIAKDRHAILLAKRKSTKDGHAIQ